MSRKYIKPNKAGCGNGKGTCRTTLKMSDGSYQWQISARIPKGRRNSFQKSSFQSFSVGKAGNGGQSDFTDNDDEKQPKSAAKEEAVDETPAIDYSGGGGTSWPSGAACGGKGMAGWRGSKFTAAVGWAAPFDSWSRLKRYFDGGSLNRFRGTNAFVLNLPMMPKDHAGKFEACARGEFDQHFKYFAQKLKQRGLGNATIALGWEASGTWFPWSIRNTNPSTYIACFRREVDAMRSVAPGLKIAWDMAKKGKLPYDVRKAYPGNSHVDVIGMSYYDAFPAHNGQSGWNKTANETRKGGPVGIYQWYNFARQNGRKFGVAEWGLRNERGGGGDNAVFIQNMHRFFKQNARNIAYENYFNCKSSNRKHHTIYPSSYNPKAASAYQKLW